MKVPKHIVITLNSVIVLIIFTIAVLTGIIYFAPNYLSEAGTPTMTTDIEYLQEAQRGERWQAKVGIDNTGEIPIKKLYLEIPENEHIKPTEGGKEKIKGGESAEILLQTEVLEDAETGETNVTFKISSEKIKEKTTTLPLTIT